MPYELAQSVSHFEDYIMEHHESSFYGLDTETTGLDTRRAKIAGLSASIKPNTGIYVPLGHQVGVNLPLEPIIEVLKKKEAAGQKAIMYNSKYDLNIIQRHAKWAPENHLDALELVYLENPDRKMKGLKLVAKEDLGVDMEKFQDLFTPEEVKKKIFDISTKSPARCVNYAASDADMTLRIALMKKHILTDQEFAVKIDTKLVEVIRRMEHNGGLVLNKEYIRTQIKALHARTLALEEQIHRMCGVKFEINSPKQLGDVLYGRLGIPSEGTTKGGQAKTDAETLEKLATTFPVVELIITYRKVSKAAGSYFEKLLRLDKLGIPVRFSFNIYSAPTFRFAAPGGDPLVDGATGVNIQAVSNGEARSMMAVNLSAVGEADAYVKDLEDDEILFGDAFGHPKEESQLVVPEQKVIWTPDQVRNLPWVTDEEENAGDICFRDTCNGCPANCADRGIDVTRRMQKGVRMIPSVRESFMAPEGYTLVSFDYDRQELVIGANMSREPRWLRALANGDDLHVTTAAAAYGISEQAFRSLPKEEYKRKRGVGKTLNFATFYGATAYTLARKADISKAAAEQVFDGFVKGHPTLFGWIEKVHIFARKNKYTTTYFGRKRDLSHIYNSSDRKMLQFGDRSAVNTAIQGTAAEVTRIAMVKVDAAFKKRGWTNKEVRFVMQIHDELAFLIRNDMLKVVSPVIKANMEFNVKSWEVQLTAGMKMGQIWGKQKEVENFQEWLEAA